MNLTQILLKFVSDFILIFNNLKPVFRFLLVFLLNIFLDIFSYYEFGLFL